MALIGYVRVSTEDQATFSQLDELKGTHPVSAAVRQLSSARGLPSSSRAAVHAGGFGGCR